MHLYYLAKRLVLAERLPDHFLCAQRIVVIVQGVVEVGRVPSDELAHDVCPVCRVEIRVQTVPHVRQGPSQEALHAPREGQVEQLGLLLYTLVRFRLSWV